VADQIHALVLDRCRCPRDPAIAGVIAQEIVEDPKVALSEFAQVARTLVESKSSAGDNVPPQAEGKSATGVVRPSFLGGVRGYTTKPRGTA
jgi:hypothetical protein